MRLPRPKTVSVTLALVLALPASCARSPDGPNAPPPGLAKGARVADIRMFETPPRVTLIDGTVLEVQWPWVLLGSGEAAQRARYWVNFNHVCSYRQDA